MTLAQRFPNLAIGSFWDTQSEAENLAIERHTHSSCGRANFVAASGQVAVPSYLRTLSESRNRR
jgi:hypothetical protein